MIDYHVHSNFSDGERSVFDIIDLAVEKGISRLAVTDHFDAYDESLKGREKTMAQLMEHFEQIREYAEEKRNQGNTIEVLCGIETCTGMDGRLRLPEGCEAACDIIITSPHYVEGKFSFCPGEYFLDEYWEAYKKKLLAMASGPGDVLGHPEGYLPIKPMLGEGTTYESRQQICREISQRYFDEAFIDALGERLAESGKAYELHGATGTPREWVAERLRDRGVVFSAGSDAHAVNILGKNERAMELIHRLGLKVWDGRKQN
ncbi:MAG: PHP domain-containing protein [Lachnospiraceae bacterium]|nr:PHP domain-containing protein [Lachnospiraceae bacterium]